MLTQTDDDIQTMTFAQLIMLGGYDKHERKALRHAEKYVQQNDSFVAREIRCLTRDLKHYRLLNLLVIEAAMEKTQAEFDEAKRECDEWIELVDKRVAGLIGYLAQS